MKYIRLNSFVVEFEDWMRIEGDTLIIGGAKHKIVDQADKLEDICDEIIFILEDSPIPYSTPYQYDKKNKMEWFKTETEIDIGFGFMKKIKEKYLAIWTYVSNQPTLKSVAKMKCLLPNGEVDWRLL